MAEPIKYESALPALLTQLNNTQRTSGSTSVQTSNANVDALTQMFQQQQATSTNAGMQAQIEELFRTGAQAVPELTAAYANARGTRSTGNSGLALSLAELQKNLAGQAAGLVTAQQAAAAKTAGDIAQATRGLTTTSSGSTQKTGNPNAQLAMMLGGSALNWADKNKLLDPLKSGIKDFMAPSAPTDFTGGFATSGGALDENSLTANYDSYDFQNVGGAAAFSGMDAAGAVSSDYSGSMLDGFGGDAYSAGMDATGAVSSEYANSMLDGFGGDAYSGVAEEAGSSVWEAGADWLGFADGGLVDSKAVKNFANGGPVTRNTNNMGAPVSRGTGQAAVNYRPAPAGAPVNRVSNGKPAPQQLDFTPNKQLGNNRDQAEPTSWGSPEQNARALGAVGMTALGMMGVPGPAIAAISAITGQPTFPGMIAQDVRQALTSPMGGPTSDATAGIANAVADQMGIDTMDALMGVTDAFGTAPAGTGFGNTNSGSGRGAEGGGFGGHGNSAGGDSGTGSSGSSGSQGGGGDASAANGGEIEGPGTGTSDSIKANLSDGEYVISADVVEMLGAGFFDNLQAKFHTPVAMKNQKQRG